MGSVLAFAPRDAAPTKKPPAAGATASIVIFPGVRYERPDDRSQDVRTARDARREKPRH
ncbi:hypothetical protein [Mesorhizobium marinum]|uniref:DUF2735 domain-containing protein n=1 Tax=Mesorhizobium marinum TaxID=3228790 RepID=A0ABV3R2N9_9HYPH